MPGQDALLVALPERHVQRVGAMLHEDFTHSRVAQQERREGFGKDVGGPFNSLLIYWLLFLPT